MREKISAPRIEWIDFAKGLTVNISTPQVGVGLHSLRPVKLQGLSGYIFMSLVLPPIIVNIFYEVIARSTDFPPKIFFTEPTIIFGATLLGTLIPLWIAERFGKFPPLKYFCP